MPPVKRKTLGNWVYRVKRRIWIYEWRTKLAQARAQAEAAMAETPRRKGRSRPRKTIEPQSPGPKSPPTV